MASTRIICQEHGAQIGGCDCAGAIVKTVPCPGVDSHAKVVREFSLNQPLTTAEPEFDQELHDAALAAYYRRNGES